MQHLFVYGTLQPGAPNEHILADVEGVWERATVRGHLVDRGWGAEAGYAGLVLDAAGPTVPGYVLSSEHLEAVWSKLDAFEGLEYERRSATAMRVQGATVEVYLYALKR